MFLTFFFDRTKKRKNTEHMSPTVTIASMQNYTSVHHKCWFSAMKSGYKKVRLLTEFDGMGTLVSM